MSTETQTNTQQNDQKSGQKSQQGGQQQQKKDFGRGSQGGDDFQRGPRNRIYISRLPYNVKDDEIRDLCRPYGAVSDVKVIPKKGIAFATFQDASAAQYALYDLMEKRRDYRGDKIYVQWAKPEEKKKKEKDDKEGEDNDNETEGNQQKNQKKGDKNAEVKKEEKPDRPLFSQFQQPKPAAQRPPKQKKEKPAQTNQARSNQSPQTQHSAAPVAAFLVPEPEIHVANVSSAPPASVSSPQENDTQHANNANQKKGNKPGNKQLNKQGNQQAAQGSPQQDNKPQGNNNKQGNNNNKQNAQTGAASDSSQQQGQGQGKGKNNNRKNNKQTKNAQQGQQNAQANPQTVPTSTPTTGSAQSTFTVEIHSSKGTTTIKGLSSETVEQYLRPLQAKVEIVARNEATGEVENYKASEEQFSKYIHPLLSHAHI